MIVEYIRYRLAEGEGDALEAAYREAAAPLMASPHCLSFELARCSEEPTVYVLRIEWDSHEGHLRGFRASEEFRSFLALVRPFVPRIEEMRHYDPIGVGGRKPTPASA